MDKKTAVADTTMTITSYTTETGTKTKNKARASLSPYKASIRAYGSTTKNMAKAY